MVLIKCQRFFELSIPRAMKLTSKVFNDVLEHPSISSLHIAGGENLTSNTTITSPGRVELDRSTR